MLNNLLNWSKSQTGKLDNNPIKIDFSSLLNKLKEDLNLQATLKDITIHIVVSKKSIVYADENMINLILRNLISNAIKFSNPGEKIDMIAIQKPNIEEISVSDNGVGMPENELHNLFKIGSVPQSKGTADEKGTGLGLILCKEFIEKLGGKIWVTSALGKGSNFKFTLPL